LAARTLREKTDPLVEVPADRGGGKIYKRTLVDEFNKDLNMSLDASRLGRIRLSTHQLSSLEQLQASQREKAAAAAGGGTGRGERKQQRRQRRRRCWRCNATCHSSCSGRPQQH
jgi:hypothetical protein